MSKLNFYLNYIMNIHLFCFVNSLEPKLLYFFLKYYLSLGIKRKNFFIILHIDKKYILNENNEIIYNNNKIKYSVNQLKKNKISFQIVNNFSSKIKRIYVNKYISKLEIGTWLIYPDLDEFFDYQSNNIYDFINKLEKDNIEMVKGIFCNRIATNYLLKDIDVDNNIFDQFPIKYYDNNNNIAEKYVQKKICALKIKKNCKYYNAHKLKIKNDHIVHEKELDIHHFKFTQYTIDSLNNKYNIYKNLGKKYNIEMYNQQFELYYKKDNKWYIKKDKLY